MKTKTLRWIKGAGVACLITLVASLATDLMITRAQLRQMRECADCEDAQHVRLIHEIQTKDFAREDALAARRANASKK